MRGSNGRLLYEIIFWGIVGALVYFYRNLYKTTEDLLNPYFQAYTIVAMLFLCGMLLMLVNYLGEAIAATAIAIYNQTSGDNRLGSETGMLPVKIQRNARRLERKGKYQAAGETYESLELWKEAAMVYERGNYVGRAANAWHQAENFGKAIEYYEKDCNFSAAGDLCLAEGLQDRATRNFRIAADQCLEHNQFKAAANFYERAQDYNKAGGIFENVHAPDRALGCYDKAGNKDKIFQLLKQTHTSEYHSRGQEFTSLVQRSAETLLQHGYSAEAARILEDCHALTRAAEVYAGCKLWEKAAELYIRADQPHMAEQMIPNIEEKRKASEMSARLAFGKGDWKAAGDLYEQAGKQSQAIDAYKKAREFNSAARIYEAMGRFIMAGEMYSSSKNFAAAANAYAKAYDWRNAAECFEASSDMTQAVEAYANAGNYLKAGTLALKMTDYPRAVEYLQRIPPAAPDFTMATAFLATAFYYQRQNDMSNELFIAVMDDLPLNRDTLPAYYAYARDLESDNPKKSLGLFRQILGIDIHYCDVSDRVQKLEAIITSIPTGNPGKTPTSPPWAKLVNTETPLPHGMSAVNRSASLSGRLIESLSMGTDTVNTAKAAPVVSTINTPLPRTLLKMDALFDGRYQIKSETCQYGRVTDHLAVDTLSGQQVTVRTFPVPNEPVAYTSTMNLLSVASRLTHSAIAKVENYGEYKSHIYTVTALTPGQNLQQWIRNRGPLSVKETRMVMGQLLEALDYAHSQDVCHLNLRPEVVIVNSGPEIRTTLTGFGAPVRQPQSTEPVYLTMPDSDPQYLAPEQIIGTDVDCRTDIYAFGLLLFFVLTGRTPFEVKRINDTQEIARMQVQVSLPRPSTIRATLPSIVDEVFLKCVNKSALSRYQTVSDLLGDLRGIQISPVV